MVIGVDLYWGSLHRVRSLIVPHFSPSYIKWILIAEKGEGPEATSIGELFIFVFTLVPNALEPSLKLLLNGPGQPHR